MNSENENFLEMLESAGLIKREDFAALSQNPTPEDIYDALTLVNASDLKLTEVYAKFRDIPFVQINSIDPAAFELIDPEIARKFGFIPFFIDETHHILQVAMNNPRKYRALNKNNLQALGQKIGYRIEVMMASEKQVEDALQAKNDEKVGSEATNSLEARLGKRNVTEEDLKSLASAGEIERLVDGILAYGILHRASDIHIEPFEKIVRIRVRIDGEMDDVIALPSSILAGVVSRIKVLAKLKIEEERIPQDGRTDVIFNSAQIDIRVSTLPTIFGEKITLRLLPKTRNQIELETLGLAGSSLEKLIKSISLPYGVIIVTGPTGSGKTTTIYSILARLDKPEVDIITLEETIEYELPRVNQVKLQPHLGFGFAEGVRSVLKQDPNIIYVGEITDKETAELTVHAALTGRLVLTTLHTNSAIEALPRLFNLGVDSFLLSSAVKAVTAQRLVRKLCPKCKEESPISPNILAKIKQELQGLNINLPLIFYRAKGCQECKSGYQGRIGIFEVLQVTPKIQEFVIEKKSGKEIEQLAKSEGFITMRQDGFTKALQGLTTVDEVIKATTMGN